MFARDVTFANVDDAAKTLKLRVLSDMCGQYDPSTKGLVHCMAMPILSLTVPYTEKMDSCRSSVLVGADDHRPSDGNNDAISLTDYSTSVCENVIANIFEVTATSTTARGNKTTTVTASGSPASHATGTVPAPAPSPSQKADDRAIYNALNVSEVALNPGIAGLGRFSKTVGRLVCLKETLIVAKAKTNYSCSLK